MQNRAWYLNRLRELAHEVHRIRDEEWRKNPLRARELMYSTWRVRRQVAREFEEWEENRKEDNR